MEPVGRTRLWSFLSGKAKVEKVTNTKIRADAGHFVDNYRTLASKVAELQWRNRGHVMLFRPEPPAVTNGQCSKVQRAITYDGSAIRMSTTASRTIGYIDPTVTRGY